MSGNAATTVSMVWACTCSASAPRLNCPCMVPSFGWGLDRTAGAQDLGQPPGPGRLPGLFGDEVVSDLDHGVEEPAPTGVKIERVGHAVLGSIRLVPPHLDVAVAAERRDQMIGIAAIAIMQDPDIEMAGHALVDRREAVDRDEARIAAARLPAVEQRPDGGVKRLV